MTPASVVLLAYDGVAGDEARTLVEILNVGGVAVVIASVEAAAITSFHGRVTPHRSAAELGSCAALVIPGGMGVQSASDNQPLLTAISDLGQRATWLGTTSTGSVVLAAAGLIDGATVTTHWLAAELMGHHDVELSTEPFVEHGRCLTAAGLASTATLAFRLVAAIAGTENEQRARAHYRPGTPSDRRYERPPHWSKTAWWKDVGRRRVQTEVHSIDPEQVAEVVLLDIHRRPETSD